MKLSVIGLGKLGACTAACFSSSGYDVIGMDINQGFVDSINAGKAPVLEPSLQDLIDQSKGKLKATTDYAEVVKNSEICFLIVPTPSREDGHFSDKYLQDALKHLATECKKQNKRDFIYVITSTVSPGTTDRVLIPLIEEHSGMKYREDFGVAYNPEFIALGSVIKDFLNPDMVLLGESHKEVGDKLVEIYKKTCKNEPNMARMSLVSGEITKISLNSYVTTKISFANTLANVCEKIPGADVDDITAALGSDKRISPYYLRGGLSFGGPCFPRDNRAFAAFASIYDYDALIAKNTDKVNEMQIEHLVNKVMENLSEKGNNVVAVLGMSYKPNTPVIEEAPGVKIVEGLLKKKDVEIVVYDPLAIDNVRARFGENILYASSVKDCFSHASLCVLTTMQDEYKAIDASYIANEGTRIIDCWRMLDPDKLGDKAKYIPIGRVS